MSQSHFPMSTSRRETTNDRQHPVVNVHNAIPKKLELSWDTFCSTKAVKNALPSSLKPHNRRKNTDRASLKAHLKATAAADLLHPLMIKRNQP